MTRRLGAVLIALLLVIAAGCDGGDDGEVATQPPSTTTSPVTGEADLRQAVRTALDKNRRLSVFVLWNNRIPAWAERSTRGPALAALRTAAVDRRTQGIRVRLLSDRFQVLSIRLDPSFTRATATASGRQRVRPYVNGKRGARTVDLNERARIELRRLGDTMRFVVWRVQVLD
jgi:hypothetical protein